MVLRSNCVCFPRNSSTLQNKRCSHSRCVYQWVPAGPAQPGQQDADEADLSEGSRSALGAHGLCHNLCRRSRSLDKRGLFWDSLALPQLSRRVWIQIPIFCRATVSSLWLPLPSTVSYSKAKGRAGVLFMWNPVLSSLSRHIYVRQEHKGRLLAQPLEIQWVLHANEYYILLAEQRPHNACLTPS